MDEPVWKTENSIGISYVWSEIHERHFDMIIERILGIPEDEISTIDSWQRELTF